MQTADKVIRFIERYCRVPEGKLVGQPIKLLDFQKQFIRAIYSGNRKVRRAYLSIARKNGKTALIACIVLAHLVGPVAVLNSQIISGARSRDQAALVFQHAEKMVRLSPELSKIVRIIPSRKKLVGLPLNVEYTAISAEAGTAHGLSPIVAILDEVGQVKGPYDAFVEAIETAQGAHDDPLLIAISTQAATDDDLFSRWIDDARDSGDESIVCHLYTAPEDASLLDEEAWRAANPAMGVFRSRDDVAAMAERADRLPSVETSFRWLFLNQRVETHSPYVAKSVWASCARSPVEDVPPHAVICGGLDLSSSHDLTAYVRVAWIEDELSSWCRFWLPQAGLREKARADRVEYDVWADQGHIEPTPGASVDYDYIAPIILSDMRTGRLHKLAYDRWQWPHFWAAMQRAGATAQEIGDSPQDPPTNGSIVRFGQGYASMSPALRLLDTVMLNGKLRHGDHPVLTMCAKNAIVKTDPAGNRKLDKSNDKRRIDGMVALAMATGIAGEASAAPKRSYLASRPLMVLGR